MAKKGGVGNWIKKGFVTFSLATAGVEKSMLSQTSGEAGNQQGTVRSMHQGTLMHDLKEGNLTEQVKQFRSHHYKVLKESEKYKFKWGKDGDFELLTEEELKSRSKAQGDPYDSYEVEISIDNGTISEGLFEETSVRPIKVRRGVFPRLKIEEHTTTVHVRNIDGKNKLIDFYIPQDTAGGQLIGEIKGLIKEGKLTDFVNFTNMRFTTPGGNGAHFSYRMLAFDKVVQHNGNFIVKMFAECEIDGRGIGDKFILD